MQGFKTLERTNVQVNANDKFSAGIVALEVGAITEEVSVTGRVSELQMTSGERGGVLESTAITNIAINGRQLFNFATLVPGAVQEGTAGADITQVSGFTVNGQRPNSNNMTIDGVANIDTGDNGGNMAMTNIDSVAEFKLLTNAYSAEYGRAVGGQLQVVTKSGTQSFHGSGYWYGRRGGWNANSWTNNRNNVPRNTEAARNDYGYTLGGPIYIPGVFNKDKKKLFFFWSQEFQRRTDPVSERLSPGAHGPRAARGLLPERRQQRQPDALDQGLHDGPAVRGDGDRRSQRLLPGRRRHGPDPREPPLAAGPQRPEHLPQLPNTNRGSGLNYASQAASSLPVDELLARIDFQPTDKWRVTGRFMKSKDNQTTGLRHHLGRRGQQQPRRHGGPVRAPRPELDGLDHRHPQQHDVARVERRQREKLARLRHRKPEADAHGRGPHRLPDALPGRDREGHHP